MRQRFVIGTVAVLVGLGALVATGAPLAAVVPQRPAKVPKPCDLLTTREVSNTLEVKVRAGKPRDIPSTQGLKTKRCDWESTKKGSGGIRGKPLAFQVVVASSADARTVFEDTLSRDVARGIPTQSVTDLGTDAVYTVSSESYAVSMTVSDTRILIVRILAASLDTDKVHLNPEEVLVAAAQLAAPRLKKG